MNSDIEAMLRKVIEDGIIMTERLENREVTHMILGSWRAQARQALAAPVPKSECPICHGKGMVNDSFNTGMPGDSFLTPCPRCSDDPDSREVEAVEKAFRDFSANGPIPESLMGMVERVANELGGWNVPVESMRLAGMNFAAGWRAAIQHTASAPHCPECPDPPSGCAGVCPEPHGDKPCEVCGGQGFTAEHNPAPGTHDEDGNCLYDCPVQVPCEACNGTGRKSVPQNNWSCEMCEYQTNFKDNKCLDCGIYGKNYKPRQIKSKG